MRHLVYQRGAFRNGGVLLKRNGFSAIPKCLPGFEKEGAWIRFLASMYNDFPPIWRIRAIVHGAASNLGGFANSPPECSREFKIVNSETKSFPRFLP